MAYAPLMTSDVVANRTSEGCAPLDPPVLGAPIILRPSGIELKRPVADEKFSTDLCCPCDPPGGCRLCLFTTVMSHWTMGLVVEQMTPDQVICGRNFWGGCCLSFWLQFVTGLVAPYVGPLVPCYLPMYFHVHRSVQKKYGIKSNAVLDCLAAWICPACLLCQDVREIMIRENAPQVNPLGPSWPNPPLDQRM